MGPNVFLSFATEHKPLVDLFRGQVQNSRSALTFRDYLIQEPVAGAWKPYAERLIRASTATLCLVGETTWRSEPVNWEVRRSTQLRKPVLAVYLQPETIRIPDALAEIGITPLPWNVDIVLGKLNEQRQPS